MNLISTNGSHRVKRSHGFSPKTLILALSLLLFGTCFSQTKQVAHKSHSGKPGDFSAGLYADNFGEYIIDFPVKKVKLYKKNCLVEIRTDEVIDTFCNHPYLSGQYTFYQIQAFYPEGTVFEGFEGRFFNDSIHREPTKKPVKKKNSFYWIAIFLFLGMGSAFILTPKKLNV